MADRDDLNEETKEARKFLAEEAAKLSPRERLENSDRIAVRVTEGETSLRLSRDLQGRWIDGVFISKEEIDAVTARIEEIERENESRSEG
jgi:hypothetical protein